MGNFIYSEEEREPQDSEQQSCALQGANSETNYITRNQGKISLFTGSVRVNRAPEIT